MLYQNLVIVKIERERECCYIHFIEKDRYLKIGHRLLSVLTSHNIDST